MRYVIYDLVSNKYLDKVHSWVSNIANAERFPTEDLAWRMASHKNDKYLTVIKITI